MVPSRDLQEREWTAEGAIDRELELGAVKEVSSSEPCYSLMLGGRGLFRL